MESLGIAGVSHHSLLFSKTAPVAAVQEDEIKRWSYSCIYARTSWFIVVDALNLNYWTICKVLV